MSPSKREASPSGGASRAKRPKKPVRTVKFNGADFTLIPAELPETLGPDLVMLEAAGADDRPFYRLLLSFLGAEQFTTIRNHIAAVGVEKSAEQMGELLSAIIDSYGASPGESSASKKS